MYRRAADFAKLPEIELYLLPCFFFVFVFFFFANKPFVEHINYSVRGLALTRAGPLLGAERAGPGGGV